MRRDWMQLWYVMADGRASEFDTYKRMELLDFYRLHRSFIKKVKNGTERDNTEV